jgi:hypothetical protein
MAMLEMRAEVPVTLAVKYVRHPSTYFHLHSKWGVNIRVSLQYNKADARSEGPAVECRLAGRKTWSGFALINK